MYSQLNSCDTNDFLKRKKLFDGTIPSNKKLSDGTVPSNNRYFIKVLFDGTLKMAKFKILKILLGHDYPLSAGAPVQEFCRKLL